MMYCYWLRSDFIDPQGGNSQAMSAYKETDSKIQITPPPHQCYQTMLYSESFYFLVLKLFYTSVNP